MDANKYYDYLQKDQIDPVMAYLRTTNVNDIPQKSIISRLFTKLDEKLQLNEIHELLLLHAKDYSSGIDYEYNQGLKILLMRRQFDHLFELLSLLLVNKKKIDNILTIVQDLLNNCYDQKRNIDKCIELIITIKKADCNISDSFWGTNILALLRLGMMSQGLELISLYPIKVVSSENTWREIISYFISPRLENKGDIFLNFFHILQKKFVCKNNDYKALEGVFNLIIEQLTINL
jgi:hypothetical protein